MATGCRILEITHTMPNKSGNPKVCLSVEWWNFNLVQCSPNYNRHAKSLRTIIIEGKGETLSSTSGFGHTAVQVLRTGPITSSTWQHVTFSGLRIQKKAASLACVL